MPFKRSNAGRSKLNCRGHTNFIRCDNCNRAVPKDKGIVKQQIKNIVEASAADDLRLATIYDNYDIPKIYDKLGYCISCAVHKKIVKPRSADKRKERGGHTARIPKV